MTVTAFASTFSYALPDGDSTPNETGVWNGDSSTVQGTITNTGSGGDFWLWAETFENGAWKWKKKFKLNNNGTEQVFGPYANVRNLEIRADAVTPGYSTSGTGSLTVT